MRQLRRARADARGMTLIELMVTLVILAIVSTLAAPAMGGYWRNGKLREAGNTVVSTLQFARNEAIKRNRPTALRLVGSELAVLDADGVALREERLPDSVSAVLFDGSGAIIDPPLVPFGGAGRTTPFGAAFKVDLALSGFACSDDLRCPRVMVRPGGAARLCKQQQDC
jgi:prepilin-type N-terminal cleavage/methylation domain-containing protein